MWVLVVSPFFFGSCLIIALLPASWRYDTRLYFRITSYWSRALLFFLRWNNRFDVRGAEHLVHREPAIIVMNHASALDILTAEALLGDAPRVWVVKKEYARVPLFGWLVRRMHILVDRGNAQASVAALRKLLVRIQGTQRHVLIFSEGTRSAHGQLQDFMQGFALLAQVTHRPVVPIYFHNAHKILPKSCLRVHAHQVTLTSCVGAPLFPVEKESRTVFTERVRRWFSAFADRLDLS